MALACRSLDPRGNPGPTRPAPRGNPRAPAAAELLTEVHASALARADEAARAFTASPIAPPEPLVPGIAAEAAALVARARIALAEA